MIIVELVGMFIFGIAIGLVIGWQSAVCAMRRIRLHHPSSIRELTARLKQSSDRLRNAVANETKQLQ